MIDDAISNAMDEHILERVSAPKATVARRKRRVSLRMQPICNLLHALPDERKSPIEGRCAASYLATEHRDRGFWPVARCSTAAAIRSHIFAGHAPAVVRKLMAQPCYPLVIWERTAHCARLPKLSSSNLRPRGLRRCVNSVAEGTNCRRQPFYGKDEGGVSRDGRQRISSRVSAECRQLH